MEIEQIISKLKELIEQKENKIKELQANLITKEKERKDLWREKEEYKQNFMTMNKRFKTLKEMFLVKEDKNEWTRQI